MAPPKSDSKIVTSADGTAIFAEATGDPKKPALVLLAGLGLSGAVYDDFCSDPLLLKELYIVRYDVRGHGRSGKPTTAEAYHSDRFAQDFKAVADAYKLDKPAFAAWSMGGAVATDISAHLPPATIGGACYIAAVPCTGDILGELVAPELGVALPGLISKDDVLAFQTSSTIFVDRLFAHPENVPLGVKALYLGHTLTPEIMGLSLARPMDITALYKAGGEGLPLSIIHGTHDGHRHHKGGPKTVDQVLQPHFKDFEMVWLEGCGHAIHYEAHDEVRDHLIKFTKRVSGKDYRQ